MFLYNKLANNSMRQAYNLPMDQMVREMKLLRRTTWQYKLICIKGRASEVPGR